MFSNYILKLALKLTLLPVLLQLMMANILPFELGAKIKDLAKGKSHLVPYWIQTFGSPAISCPREWEVRESVNKIGICESTEQG